MALTKNNNIPSINLTKKLGFIYNEDFDDYHEKDDVYLFNVPKEISSTWLQS